MRDKETAYAEIFQNLINDIFVQMELKNLIQDPATNLSEPNQFPAIVVQRGLDRVVKRVNNRGPLGFPSKREFTIVIDYGEVKDRQIGGEVVSIAEKINIIRRAVLKNGKFSGTNYLDSVAVAEKSLAGPNIAPLPDHQITRFEFTLLYTDEGFEIT